MKNQVIIDNLINELKRTIEHTLPDYKVIIGTPLSNETDKHVSIFPYDVERIVSLDYSLYHTGLKSILPKKIPTDLKFLITIFDSDGLKSAFSLIELYSRLHKPHFFKFEDENSEITLLLESGGLAVWQKLFPESNYKQSIPLIVSGVMLSIDDS